MKKICLLIAVNLMVTCAIAQSLDSLVPQGKNGKGIKTTFVNGSPMAGNQNIVQNVGKVKDYSILLNAIKSADLAQTFESKGPITIFAPTNIAFTKLPAGKLDSLLKPENKFELSSLVTCHAIAGKISSRDISKNIREHKGTAKYITLAGTKIMATIDANRNIVLTDETGAQCIISQFDVEQSNGMLHVVNSLIVPKAKSI